jgi:hypothetical protein
MARFALVLVGLALLGAGCDSGDESTSTGTETQSDQVLADASTDPVVEEGSAAETALLTTIEVTAQEGYERVVFEFENEVPGYDVRYVERPVIADGSGDEVEVEGGHVLVVRMEPALDADLTQEDAPATYTGATRFSPDDTSVITELVRTGGFEAVLTWAIGTNDEAPFLVTTLDGPPRLVIDLGAP